MHRRVDRCERRAARRSSRAGPTPAATLRALARAARSPSLGPWVAGSLAVAVAAAARHLGRRRSSATPDPRAAAFAGVARPADVGRLRLHPLPQRRSCSRCTRWPASPASWPARRCRSPPPATRGWWRRVHDRAGPLAIAFVIARDAVLARHAGLRARRRRRRRSPPQLRHLARAAAARASLPHALPELTRAVPPARRLDPSPAGAALERAAGRDVRHRRDRRARPARRGRRRGLGPRTAARYGDPPLYFLK